MNFKFFDKLSQDFSELINDKKEYNVIIEVDKEINKKSFTAHSVVLRYRSPYFDKELESATASENHIKTIIKPSISAQIFEIILKYIYGGIVNIEDTNTKTIYELMINANELELKELSVKLESYLIEFKASWLRTYFSLVYRSVFNSNEFKDLKKFYNDIIVKYPNLIFDSEDFTSLQETALISILKRDDLNVEEIKIWDYVIKWGIAQNPTLPTNSEKWSNENFMTLKMTLQHCLPLIRYFHIPGKDIWKNIKPYEKILEKQLWDDMILHSMSPNEPINSFVLPARIISSPESSSRIISAPNCSPTPNCSLTPNLFSTLNLTSTPDLFSFSTDNLTSTPNLLSDFFSTRNSTSIPDFFSTRNSTSTPDFFSTPNLTSTPDLTSTTDLFSTPDLLSTPNTFSTPDLLSTPNTFSTLNLTSTTNFFSTPNSTSTPNTFLTDNLTSTTNLFSTDNLTSTPNTFSTPHLTSRTRKASPTPPSGMIPTPNLPLIARKTPNLSSRIISTPNFPSNAYPRSRILSMAFSTIINKEHVAELSSWIDRKSTTNSFANRPYGFQLILRGSRDGFHPKTFWNMCNGYAGTIVVARVIGTDEIVGGYNPTTWDKNSIGKVETKDSFIFSLKNGNLHNSILSRVKMSRSKSALNYPIEKNIYGPWFGECEFMMKSEVSDFTQGKQCSGYSYRKFYEKSIKNCEKFSIVDYEVFLIIKK
ncbi:hypothetical protein Glove_482g69 [Diversispora epigaea]|uniref:BTB domain-containing protein n=1 Tax=Diversispora epigaea TaxID=1348612 RepID=A0A397GNW7_9GLOM|nr:hypothetical protein Glove_482g69 [Diversispora epigaea]